MTGVIKYILLIVFQPHFIQLIYYLFMNRIEFIGSSCVGKSTLFAEVLHMRNKDDLWSYPLEAQLNIIKQMQRGRFSFSRKGLIVLGLLKSQHAKWAKEILDNHKEQALMQYADAYDGLIKLYMEHILNDKEVSSIRKLQLLNLYYNRVVFDLIILAYFSPGTLSVYDDGVMAINSGILDVKEFKSIALGSQAIKEVVMPTAIVYCKLSLEATFERMKKRINEGKGNYAIRRMTDLEISETCKKGLQAADGIFKVLNALRVPSIEVNMEEDISINAHKVSEYIRTFC